MNALRIETTVETDGELHLTQSPCRKGDRVEAIVLVLDAAQTEGTNEEQNRKEALLRFNARADASRFRSVGPYPTRDELHERH